jgi:F-type H+-transporting ATPase subunit a
MKKFMRVLGLILVVMLIVNLILWGLQYILPISYVTPPLIEGPKVFWSLKLGGLVLDINQTIVTTWIVMAILSTILAVGTRNLSVENPTRFQVLLEMLYGFIENMFLANFGKYKKAFVSFITALFSFIFFCNLISFFLPFIPLIEKMPGGGYSVSPFLRTPTADMNTTVGLALLVVVIFLSCAIKTEGVFGYIKGLASPTPVLLIINVIGEIAKPINTSMRLFGNMFAGIIIMGLLYGLTINVAGHLFAFAPGWVAFLHLYFDLFTGTIQSFVFVVLSSVYISETLGDKDEVEEAPMQLQS